ncbi:putative RNA-binding protein Luc7-like 2 isoform X2 [Gordionus sp. m RMFG-2023]|uniref:putative RNA-binding protein Luc7-like 2 isoform X2 n=1 Tax=Gordionus sp. m RMFG-2023 TaxID=3053472 RepID=UPI0031FBA710
MIFWLARFIETLDNKFSFQMDTFRMDIGTCPRVHKLALRADYEMAFNKRDYYFDIDTMEHLQAFISDCDRKTEIAKRKLAETQEELDEENQEKANKVHEMGEQIGKKLAQAEELGVKGDVDASMKLLEEVEALRKTKSDAEVEFRNSMPASSYQQQKLRVCEICSAYLGIHDNERRLADHFGGKLHLGFIKIREKLEELKGGAEERKVLRDLDRSKRRDERSRTPNRKHKHKHHKHKHHHHHKRHSHSGSKKEK